LKTYRPYQLRELSDADDTASKATTGIASGLAVGVSGFAQIVFASVDLCS
jgi:hypothetical protein